MVWNEGAFHLYGWQLLIAWLSLCAFVNTIQLLCHLFIQELNKQPCTRIILWSSLIGLIFDLHCLIQCSFNLAYREFVGGSLFCILQAFWSELFMMLSGISVTCLMLAAYMPIVHNRTLTRKEIDCIHVGGLLYSNLLAILGCIVPGKGTLNSSGLFCYTSGQAFETLLFHIAYLFPLLVCIFFLWTNIYLRVQRMTRYLTVSRARHVTTAKHMVWYICVLFLCYLPYEVGVIYSWITMEQPPYQMWIIFGISMHVLTVINPILYYFLNPTARQLVLQACGKEYETEDIYSSFQHMLCALQDPILFHQICIKADEMLCSESLFFWKDMRDWEKLRDQGKRTQAQDFLHHMNQTYFVEHAPLQLNLSFHLRTYQIGRDPWLWFKQVEKECLQLLHDNVYVYMIQELKIQPILQSILQPNAIPFHDNHSPYVTSKLSVVSARSAHSSPCSPGSPGSPDDPIHSYPNDIELFPSSDETLVL